MKSTSAPYLHVKIAGGATAQCLGLMNAIYASSKLGIPFKISYYPYSTGTYWPFAIKALLNESEVLNLNINTRGLANTTSLETGKIIKSHPLFRTGFSYEKFLSLIRYLKLESKLQFIRKELAIGSSPSKLSKISKHYKTISGGFAQINEPTVNKEMNLRFYKAAMKSPFSKSNNISNLTILHYRLGDKKATPAQMERTKDFNTDLIIDPISYVNVLKQITNLDEDNIFVVSDEPELAQKLLLGVGLKAKINSRAGNIWEDVSFMSQANVFIGSKSQVSQLVNICVEANGGKSFMLNLLKPINYEKFPNTNYVKAKFLEANHSIYSLDFELENNAHTAYQPFQNN
jgi:hypothetical protein